MLRLGGLTTLIGARTQRQPLQLNHILVVQVPVLAQGIVPRLQRATVPVIVVFLIESSAPSATTGGRVVFAGTPVVGVVNAPVGGGWLRGGRRGCRCGRRGGCGFRVLKAVALPTGERD